MDEEDVVYVANMQYEWQLLEQAGSLPLDIVRNILTSYVVSAIRTRSTGQRRLSGGDVQCPRCNTPRIANLLQSRLLSRPHNSHTIRKIMKKERNHPEKLTTRERKRLLAFKHGENTMEVTCLVCHYKTRENFSVPQKEVAKDTLLVETKKKKKKKKKSVKEVNAGLLLSSKTPDTHSEEGGKSESGNTSQTPKPTHVVVVADQSTTSQTKPKSGKKKFEKIPRKGQVVDKPNVSEKSHFDRTNKSLPTSSHAAHNFTSDKLSFKAKKERHKKLSSLGNVIIKEVTKESSEKNQNASLEDFLGSLF
ncbi:hypothetical protein Pcinc_042008 [Petrolisthes cinctipes]|uniref:Uncharacterized protein n=1 Tax=Petrolisthes cinctipes TaxID=88211 RepID=A0AAE1BKV6_PETCI|nr:hypothetical protein Pcinc_042008 [Petrolisthes cinctipes]